jgi:hypothetical protein
MINYTERIGLLMADVVARVPTLSFLDMNRVLVFARAGRANTEGPYATCHCVSLPPSEPGYYYWRDRNTGALTRRSEWFVTKSPVITRSNLRIDYMVSFALPRFCDQPGSRKQVQYAGHPAWITKLDTIVHELYHIDPERPGIRRMERADGTCSANCHGQRFFANVVEMVKQYLDTKPDPYLYDFLRYDFSELTEKYGGVAGTAFRGFPSYPQRYTEVLDPQPKMPGHDDCPVEPLKLTRAATAFNDRDLTLREFLPQTSRLLVRESGLSTRKTRSASFSVSADPMSYQIPGTSQV